MHFNGLVLPAVEEVHLLPPLLPRRHMIFIYKRKKENGIKGRVLVVFVIRWSSWK